MDYKEYDNKETRSHHFKPLSFAILASILVLVITGLVSYVTSPEKSFSIPLIRHHLSLAEVQKAPWVTVTVQKGDYLSKLFSEHDLNYADYTAILKLKESKSYLEKLTPGDKIYLLLDKSRLIRKLIYLIDPVHYLLIERHDNQLTEKIVARRITMKEIVAKGTIHQSFLLAAYRAGLSTAVTNQLKDIFGWDINLEHSTQPNDQFKVLYDAYFDTEGKEVKSGDIIAAEFINNNKPYYAIRYEIAKDKYEYFRPNGRSVRRAFLRVPVKYKYVSSPFGYRRLHPILHIVRPHDGVDLAAPTGTPIHATADGRIIFEGRRGGYGKCIIMQNGPHYSTLFAHMSRYSPHFHEGSYVNENQIIGYVGQTGLATGSHVHYEFRINGVHYDPMKVKLPSANPVPYKERAAYLAYAQQMVARLDNA